MATKVVDEKLKREMNQHLRRGRKIGDVLKHYGLSRQDAYNAGLISIKQFVWRKDLACAEQDNATA